MKKTRCRIEQEKLHLHFQKMKRRNKHICTEKFWEAIKKKLGIAIALLRVQMGGRQVEMKRTLFCFVYDLNFSLLL